MAVPRFGLICSSYARLGQGIFYICVPHKVVNAGVMICGQPYQNICGYVDSVPLIAAVKLLTAIQQPRQLRLGQVAIFQ